MRYFKGKYRPKNPDKYMNPKRVESIIFRSSWEKSLMIWLDKNSDVIIWGSEEIVIPYISKADGKQHRYFIDFYARFRDGRKLLIEVKPFGQTQKPGPRGKKRKKTYLREVMTYATNISKWEYARAYAKKYNMEFVIWSENELQGLGINLNPSKRFRAVAYGKRKKKNVKKAKN